MSHDPVRFRRAGELFDELLDLDDAARAARISRLHGEDAELAAEVERLLAADRGSGLLDHGVGAMAPTVVDGLSAPAPEPAAGATAGDMIGPFRLQRLLGRGGMGEVFLAERSDSGFVQQVALKLLKRGMDSDEIVRRFVQERRILAQLNHPHIARFLDGGLAAGGRPWYAMEYVDGATLTEHARAKALDVRARVELLARVCDAVAYAHTQLVVHRDLKPSNILVDANGQPRVLDFGIAKLLDEGEDANATATGSRVMSPAYAAPEQVLGEAIGTPTDVYALGVVLFELLTGELPHRRSGRTPEALARDVSQESVTRPSQALRDSRSGEITGTYGATSLNRERVARQLAGDLDTIVLAALQREPARRYPTAAALADDLRRWLEGRPVSARPDTARYRMAKFVRRHRGGVLASLVTVLALVGGLGLALWQAREAREQATRADGEAQRATLEAARAETQAAAAKEMTTRTKRVKDFLISVFLQEDPLRRDARGALTMAEAFDDTLKRIDTELADDPALQGDLLDDFGEIVTAKGDFEKAQGMFERALANAERAHGPDDPAVAESLVNLGVLADYRGNLAAGAPYLERAVAILEARADTDPALLAQVYMSLGALQRNQGDLAGATARMQRALELYGGPDGDNPQRLVAMVNLSIMLVDANKFAEAEALLKKTIAGMEAAQGAEAGGLIIALSTLEQVLDSRDDFEEQQRVGERRLALARKLFPGDHSWKSMSLADTGWYLVRAGKVEEGEARMREAIAAYDRMGDVDMPAIGARRRLALSQQRRDDYAGALQTLDGAATLCRPPGIAGNLMCLTVRANRADVLAYLGDGATALVEADAALEGLLRTVSADADEVAQAHQARAAALAALDRDAEALAAQREAVDIYTRLYGAGNSNTQTAQRRVDALQAPTPNR
jgi:serine/threonine-protein kinase